MAKKMMSFVEGSKDKKTPKPKSEAPREKTSHKADVKREGKGTRSVKY